MVDNPSESDKDDRRSVEDKYKHWPKDYIAEDLIHGEGTLEQNVEVEPSKRSWIGAVWNAEKAAGHEGQTMDRGKYEPKNERPES